MPMVPLPAGYPLDQILAELKTIDGLVAVVLGGSWAAGRERPDSDVDLGLYYRAGQPLDTDAVKRVAARHVPRECVYRPKEGFSIPIKNWLGGELRPMADDLLSSERLRREGVFRVETVERLRRDHDAGRANHSHVLWSLMVFEDWRTRWGV